MKRLSIALAALLVFASVNTSAQTKPAGPEQTLLNMEQAWAAAYLKGDVAGIDALLAPNFTSVSPEGKVVARAEYLADAGKAKATKSSNSDMKVTMLGANAAVVTGIWTGTGTDAKGQKFDTAERWTDVFVNQGMIVTAHDLDSGETHDLLAMPTESGDAYGLGPITWIGGPQAWVLGTSY